MQNMPRTSKEWFLTAMLGSSLAVAGCFESTDAAAEGGETGGADTNVPDTNGSDPGDTGTTPTCSGALSECEGSCVDTRHDPDHCGGCGIACDDGDVCISGSCQDVSQAGCPDGLSECGGSCVNTSNDPDHCGDCGESCDTGEACQGGSCVFACVGGTTDCSGSCVNTSNDPDHCGDCGEACDAGEVCHSGSCVFECVGGTIDCGGSCIDPSSSNAHCGAEGDCEGDDAGESCAAGQVCSEGECVATCQDGLVVCDGGCIDPMTNSAYCGVDDACTDGMVCAPFETCAEGVCTCAGGTTNGLVEMPPQTSTFTGNVRGYWFTAPNDFVISGARVPNDQTGTQYIHIMRLDAEPPIFSATTNEFTTLAYLQSDSLDFLPTCIAVSEGDVIGVLGYRGSVSSYAGTGPSDVVVNGVTTTLTRLIFQGSIQDEPATDLSSSANGIARIELLTMPAQ